MNFSELDVKDLWKIVDEIPHDTPYRGFIDHSLAHCAEVVFCSEEDKFPMHTDPIDVIRNAVEYDLSIPARCVIKRTLVFTAHRCGVLGDLERVNS